MTSSTRTPTTAPSARKWLPQPAAKDEAMGWGGQLEAIDAIWAAYMALNASGGGHEPLAVQDGPQSPMSLVAKGAVAALARIDGVGTRGAEKIWDAMCDGASGARWAYDLWRRGDI